MDITGPFEETFNYEPPQIVTFKEVKFGDRIAGDIVQFSGKLTPSGRWEIETRGGIVLRGVESSLIEVEKKIWYKSDF